MGLVPIDSESVQAPANLRQLLEFFVISCLFLAIWVSKKNMFCIVIVG
jgi:hypothetical protein